jgi:hypothetical protein
VPTNKLKPMCPDPMSPFRRDSIRRIDLLVQDADARRVAVAWEGMPVKWRAPPWAAKSDGGNADWDRLWKSLDLSLRELGTRAGLPLAPTVRVFEMLRANRLVFPDGTLDAAAARLLDALAAEHLRTTAKKRAK